MSFLNKILNIKKRDPNKGKISEWSFQRFSGFYDVPILPDPAFMDKMHKIVDCVKNRKIESIDEIARESNCTFEECVMKIKYLKNKRILEDYYIDRINKVLKKCDEYDQKILEKYYVMLYINHYQINEMAIRVPNLYNKSLSVVQDGIFNDIKYLYDKCIINGIKLDEENKRIIYYTVEKHKKALLYATINCSKCGALVDVSRGGNGRCSYCGSIEEDNTV